MFSQIIQNSWYRPFGIVTLVLLPLTFVFCVIVYFRRILFKSGILSSTQLSVPVIVIGNISVGGTGKTPLVIAIAQYLKYRGFKPGIVSRGYGGQARQWPQSVTEHADPVQVGDEAVLIARRSGCPVSVAPERVKAAKQLLQEHACDIILSDDGLQHLALQRDVEIVVIDGERRFGNGFCLPGGPLRELPARINSVDLVVTNGEGRDHEHSMQLAVNEFMDVTGSGKTVAIMELSGKKAHAISAIGNNERFFKVLENLNIDIVRHSFPDHFNFQQKDVQFDDSLPVLMTEKDAVKCRHFDLTNTWYLTVDAKLGSAFYDKLDELIKKSSV